MRGAPRAENVGLLIRGVVSFSGHRLCWVRKLWVSPILELWHYYQIPVLISCICRAHAVDYVVLFAMMLALAFSELATPYQRYIYEQDDQVRLRFTHSRS